MKVPVTELATKLSATKFKKEIQKIAKFRCSHGHSGLSHYNCYRNEKGKPERFCFFDIETSNLKANFGIILSWCIKEVDGKIHYDVYTKKDMESGHLDKRVVESCIEKLKEFDVVVTHYGCLTPGHRVLTSDLQWVPVETLKEGDRLLGFEAEPSDKPQRKFLESTVVQNILLPKECYEIHLSDGTVLTATGDHPWLVKDGVGAGMGHYDWRTTEQLYKTLSSKLHIGGINFNRVFDVWEKDNSRDGGWIAGFFDGEGCTTQTWNENCMQPHYSLTISASQNVIKNKDVFEEAKRCLDSLSISYGASEYDKKNHCSCFNILGDKGKKLKFLGSIRPTKLLRQFDCSKLGTIRSSASTTTKITKIIPVGIKQVCGLGTTTETYIAEGFLCHNSRFDLPFLRTRALMHKIDFPSYGDMRQIDTYDMAKRTLALHSNRQDVIAEALQGKTVKTRIDSNYWIKALQGNKEALDYVLTHNKMDVVDLEKNYNALVEFNRKINKSI